MRFNNRMAALSFVQGFLGDPCAIATLRRLLSHSRSDVRRLSDAQVLTEIATSLDRSRFLAPYQVRGNGAPAVEVEVQKAQMGQDQPSSRRIVRESVKEPVKEEEIYVVAAEVKTIGDTPLVNHAVRILDPDTGKVVVDSLTTDDAGVVRARVPENKAYRIEIIDQELESGIPDLIPDEEPAVLLCHFVDEGGIPLAHQEVEARLDDDKFGLTTDEDGRIEVPASLGHYELKIGDQAFHAHALLMKDRERKENLYRFVVGSNAELEDSDGVDLDDRLPQYDAPPEDEEAGV